jgi:hypothetical protein
MSKITELASGQLNGTASIVIELVETRVTRQPGVRRPMERTIRGFVRLGERSLFCAEMISDGRLLAPRSRNPVR